MVGTAEDGLRNMMVITDGALKVRGKVGNPHFHLPAEPPLPIVTPPGQLHSNSADSTSSTTTSYSATMTSSVVGAETDTPSGFIPIGSELSSLGPTPAPPMPVGPLLGAGQVQVVRNHPFWKQPMSGIVAMREDVSVELNLALYLSESEQRPAVLLTDVQVGG